MMQEFSRISAIWRAPLFSRALYQDVALRWRGIGTLYMMLLLAVTWFVVLAKFTTDITRYANGEAASDLADFPTMTITRGHLSSPVKQPHVFRINGQPLFVLDTTGEVKRPGERGAQVLITETEIIQEQPGTTRTTPLAGVPDMVVDQGNVVGWIRTFRNMVIPIGLPLFWAFSLAWRLICALILGAIGLGFAAMFGGRIGYPALLRLAMVAMTPVLLIDTVLWLTNLNVGCFTWLVYPLITLGYMAFAVKAVADITKDAPPAFPVEPAMMTEPGVAGPVNSPVPPETDRLFP